MSEGKEFSHLKVVDFANKIVEHLPDGWTVLSDGDEWRESVKIVDDKGFRVNVNRRGWRQEEKMIDFLFCLPTRQTWSTVLKLIDNGFSMTRDPKLVAKRLFSVWPDYVERCKQHEFLLVQKDSQMEARLDLAGKFAAFLELETIQLYQGFNQGEKTAWSDGHERNGLDTAMSGNINSLDWLEHLQGIEHSVELKFSKLPVMVAVEILNVYRSAQMNNELLLRDHKTGNLRENRGRWEVGNYRDYVEYTTFEQALEAYTKLRESSS